MFATMLWLQDLFLALPLVAAISLVYSATRDEEPGRILSRARHIAQLLVGFMVCVVVVLALMSWWVS